MWKKSHQKHAERMKRRNQRRAALNAYYEMIGRANLEHRNRNKPTWKAPDWESIRQMKRQADGKQPFEGFPDSLIPIEAPQ